MSKSHFDNLIKSKSTRLLFLLVIGIVIVPSELLFFYGTYLYRPRIFGAGDSLMAMSDVLPRLSEKLGETNNEVWEYSNAAKPGWRLEVEVLDRERSTYLRPHFPWKRDIVWLLAGTNDLGNSVGGKESVDSLLNNVVEFFEIQQKAGFSKDDCFYTDLLPRSEATDPTFEVDRRSFNSQLDSRLKGLAHVIHSGSNPELGDSFNADIYYDGLHPTNVGNELLANDALKAINEYFR
jgi:hypothetical protein